MINTREIAEEYRLSHWAKIMHERVQSGLSIKAFCKQIGICGNTYFYWQRRVRAAACEHIASTREETKSTGLIPKGFTEVKLSEPPKEVSIADIAGNGRICIEVGGMRITADNAYPPVQLAELLNGIIPLC